VTTRSRRPFARGARFSLALASTMWAVRLAYAHEATAEAPDFAEPECVVVIEAGEELSIPYTVALDDTELMVGDIAVSDAKTHQFFAFRGALHPREGTYELYAFEPATPGSPAPRLPAWISRDDVKRAAAASGVADGTGFSEDLVPDSEVLVDNAAFDGLWLRITADEERVPITQTQAALGARWQLEDATPGLYTIAGYIFSPPFNGWMSRSGIVKVLGAGSELPAAVVAPTRDIVRGSQGRRVTACVDAPAGTHVRGDYTFAERPEEGYQPFLAERPLRAEELQGELELCFANPRPELSGSVRIRLTLSTPDGATTLAYAPDTLTVLAGDAVCSADEQGKCCPENAPAAGSASDGGLTADAGEGLSGGPRVREPRATTPDAPSSCSAGTAPVSACTPAFFLLLLVLPARLRARRRRLSSARTDRAPRR
jgi:hypothetical protein